MKKLFAGVLLTFLFTANVFAVGGPPPLQSRRDILGVRIGMSAEEARSQLKKIGRFQKEERKRHEVWEVSDPYFSHLIVQFDKAKLVHFVTAVAREDAKRERMPYSAVAEIKNARKKTVEAARKNYRYEWELGAAGRDPKINIVAWGRDPQYLQYYSIERAN